MTRYIKFKRIARKIKKLDCEHINDWIDTCNYKRGDFIEICDGDEITCDCTQVTSKYTYEYTYLGDEICGKDIQDTSQNIDDDSLYQYAKVDKYLIDELISSEEKYVLIKKDGCKIYPLKKYELIGVYCGEENLPDGTTIVNELPEVWYGILEFQSNYGVLGSEHLLEYIKGYKSVNTESVEIYQGNSMGYNPDELSSLCYYRFNGDPNDSNNYILNLSIDTEIPTFEYMMQKSDVYKIRPDFLKGCNKIISVNGAFKDCEKLIEIPNNLFADCTELITADEAFYNCFELKEIPNELFSNNVKLESCNYTFYRCWGLNNIPEDLFKNNINLTTVSHCFDGSYNITAIPASLFENNRNIINIDYCFNALYNITTIHSRLLYTLTNITSAVRLFGGCSSLVNIPPTLFVNNVKLTDINQLFASCSNLLIVPNGIFDTLTEITDVSSCFYFCQKLVSIPNKLFANNKKIENISSCFYRCESLTSKTPIDLNEKPIYQRIDDETYGYKAFVSYDNCFYECNKMEDFDLIPQEWK